MERLFAIFSNQLKYENFCSFFSSGKIIPKLSQGTVIIDRFMEAKKNFESAKILLLATEGSNNSWYILWNKCKELKKE